MYCLTVVASFLLDKDNRPRVNFLFYFTVAVAIEYWGI